MSFSLSDELLPPDLSGRLTSRGHELAVRVYFEDTDFSGVVYHARYLHYFERGRSDMLRLKGVHHHELSSGSFGEPLYFVVKSMTLDFQSPARIDDVLIVETVISGIKGVRVLMQQRILRHEQVIATADLAVLLINDAGKPRRLPNVLSDIFNS